MNLKLANYLGIRILLIRMIQKLGISSIYVLKWKAFSQFELQIKLNFSKNLNTILAFRFISNK